MSKKIDIKNLDVNALLKEVVDEVDSLLKSEQLAKEEGSAYEEQSPTADENPEQSPMDAAPEAGAAPEEDPAGQAPEAGANPEEDIQSLEQMVQALDDQMLGELKQVVDMELQNRQGQSAQAPMPEASMQQPPEASAAPEAGMPSPEMNPQDPAMKSEIEKLKGKLAKSETESSDLKKSIDALTELVDKIVSRPVQKAVTSIDSVKFSQRGGDTSQKTEEEILLAAKSIARDHAKLQTLTKNEREVLSDYFISKKSNPEVLKIINK